MPPSLRQVAAVLDALLAPAASTDPDDGLLVAGRPEVARIGAALNTSFAAVEAAAAAGVDLLLVHHAPWAVIDLHLRDRKLARLAALGISLYVAHDSLDRAPGVGVARTLAALLGLAVAAGSGGELIVGTSAEPDLGRWLTHASQALGTPLRAWPNNPIFRRVAVVPGAGGHTRYLAEAARLQCDTFLTGEGSLYTELFAREVGLTLVYASHAATEFPGICALAGRTAAECGLPWVALPEAPGISGGGPAPLQVGW